MTPAFSIDKSKPLSFEALGFLTVKMAFFNLFALTISTTILWLPLWAFYMGIRSITHLPSLSLWQGFAALFLLLWLQQYVRGFFVKS